MQKKLINMTSKHFILSTMVFALSVQGCAHEANTIVNPPTQALPNVEQQPAAQTVTSPPPAPIIQQYALDRLKKMSETLASAKSFTYRSNNFMEVQSAATGQFLTLFVSTDVALQRPNKFRANVFGDVPSFELYFDGANFSAFDPQKNVHSVSEPLSTIDDMLSYVATKSHINFPAADFLYSDPYSVMAKNVTHAIVIGPSMVNGVSCEHFAYMEPDINLEIWIENGKKALPLRVAMTYKQVPNFPRFMIEYKDWKLNPKLKEDIFVFKAPVNAKQLMFDMTESTNHQKK